MISVTGRCHKLTFFCYEIQEILFFTSNEIKKMIRYII